MSIPFDPWTYVTIGIVVFVTEVARDLYKLVKDKLASKAKNKKT